MTKINWAKVWHQYHRWIGQSQFVPSRKDCYDQIQKLVEAQLAKKPKAKRKPKRAKAQKE